MTTETIQMLSNVVSANLFPAFMCFIMFNYMNSQLELLEKAIAANTLAVQELTIYIKGGVDNG